MKHAVQRIHFVGIGGSGMSGIAEILHNLGYTISGSDLADSATLRRLASLGIQTHVGHDAAHVARADAVVTSTAVQAGNPEVLRARALHRWRGLWQLAQPSHAGLRGAAIALR